MFMTTPEVARLLHAERHRELVDRAAAYRRRKQWKAAQRAAGTNRRRSWRDRMIRTRDHDRKIVRLRGSWLAPDRRAARLLAQAADEVDLPAGTVLEPGRFGYVGLDAAHAGLVVGDGTPPVELEADATVLVMSTHDLRTLAGVIPTLADAMSRATAITRAGGTTPRRHARPSSRHPDPPATTGARRLVGSDGRGPARAEPPVAGGVSRVR